MGSEVDICNLALSHISDPGQIVSITPPDGTRQAALCQRFYPIARRVALQSHDWGFCTYRTTLADMNDPAGVWLYRYARPSTALRVSKVLPPTATRDEPTQPFITETDAAGVVTLLTDVEEAEALLTFDVTDTTVFTPMFESALSYLLASYLAGPIIKGKAGVAVSEGFYKRYVTEKSIASMADSAEHKPDRSSITPRSIAARS